jgi:hypothetical protein
VRARLRALGVRLPLHTRLYAPGGGPDGRAARELRRQLRTFGVQARLVSLPAAAVLAAARASARAVPLGLVSYAPAYADPSAVVDRLLAPTGDLALARVGDRRVQRSLAARGRFSGEARTRALDGFAQRVVDADVPAVVLWLANFPYVRASGIRGTFAQPVYLLDLAALAPAT